jgi:hypothetical protein
MAESAREVLTPDAIYRRAGGRRRCNKWRKAEQFWRRVNLHQMMKRDSPLGGYGLIIILPGAQRAWAAELGVSDSTISRDVTALHGRAYERLELAKRAAGERTALDLLFQPSPELPEAKEPPLDFDPAVLEAIELPE